MIVIDDVYVSDNNVQMLFDDGSDVVVREVHDSSPPHFVQVDGDFTDERVSAITNYSRLAVRRS
jgi:hypothetical protein